MNQYHIHFLGGTPGSRIEIEADFWEVSTDDFVCFYREQPQAPNLCVLGIPAALNPIIGLIGATE